jgi:hypothetical protein
MNKINRMAVLLVGELRTWPIAHRYLFNLFADKAQQVDYYFVTWNTSTETGQEVIVTDADVVSPFNDYNQNLVSYKIIEPIGKQRTTFWNQSWLAKVGNILKRQHEQEQGFVYDQVVETRPDIYLRRNTQNRPWEPCKDFDYEAGMLTNNDNGFLCIDDWYFRTNSFTNDLLASRYSYKKPLKHYTTMSKVHWQFYNQHWSMVQHLYRRMLKPRSQEFTPGWKTSTDYSFFCAIRPNFPTDVDLDTVPWETLDQWFISWGRPFNDVFYGPQSPLPVQD